MADNASGTGFGGIEVPFALDDIGGFYYPRYKITFGVDGVATDVSSSNPLPVAPPINGFPIDVNGAQVEAANPLPVTIASGSSVVVIGTNQEDTPHVSGDNGFPMLAVRQDADASAAANGDYTSLHTDTQGRLKVADRNDVVTTFTQAGVIAINTDLLVIDCQGFEAVSIHCTSMGTTGVVTPSWSNTNVTAEFINQSIMTPAGVAAATFNAVGMWVSVKQARFLRLRLTTATTAGTTTINVLGIAQGLNMPVQVQPVSGTVTVNGTVTATVANATVLPAVPATPYFLNSAATTNGALIITGTSNVSAFYATNEGATAAYIKLYNKATAPTVGTDVPEMIIPVPAAVAGVPGVANPQIGFHGFRFPLGLGIAITRNAVFSDTTAIGAGEVKVKLSRAV
jgi:hypothetical protein